MFDFNKVDGKRFFVQCGGIGVGRFVQVARFGGERKWGLSGRLSWLKVGKWNCGFAER